MLLPLREKSISCGNANRFPVGWPDGLSATFRSISMDLAKPFQIGDCFKPMKLFLPLLLALNMIPESYGQPKQATPTPEILYIMDPMCSWCYGFSPEITQLKEKYDTIPEVRFKILAGGLRPGNTKTMDAEMEKFLSHHWQQVNKRTSQPFSYEILKSRSFIYDTEPVDIAVTTMWNIDSTKAFDYVKRLQTAFYFENKDITKFDVLADLAEAFGVDQKEFRKKLESEEMKKKTWDDFRYAHSLDATGFPTVLLKVGDEYHTITIGYTNFKRLDKQLDKILKKLP